jgi:hypothetical protein
MGDCGTRANVYAATFRWEQQSPPLIPWSSLSSRPKFDAKPLAASLYPPQVSSEALDVLTWRDLTHPFKNLH